MEQQSKTAELKTKVFETLGTASMCWSETPKGVFDSTLAEKIGNELWESIMIYVGQERKEGEGVSAEQALDIFDSNKKMDAMAGEFWKDGYRFASQFKSQEEGVRNNILSQQIK